MAKLFEVYKCEICGNIVEVLHGGAGKLVCCGEDMAAGRRREDTVMKSICPCSKRPEMAKISVGSTRHPMEEALYWWIVGAAAGLPPASETGRAPDREFAIPAESVTSSVGTAIHGLWRADRNTPDG